MRHRPLQRLLEIAEIAATRVLEYLERDQVGVRREASVNGIPRADDARDERAVTRVVAGVCIAVGEIVRVDDTVCEERIVEIDSRVDHHGGHAPTVDACKARIGAEGVYVRQVCGAARCHRSADERLGRHRLRRHVERYVRGRGRQAPRACRATRAWIGLRPPRLRHLGDGVNAREESPEAVRTAQVGDR